MRFFATLSALAGALVVAPQSAARADLIVPSLAITPTSGNVNTDAFFIPSIATNAGVAGTVAGATYVFRTGLSLGPVSAVRTPVIPVSQSTFGFDGISAVADRSLISATCFVSDRLLNATSLSTGDFELRYYWFATATPDLNSDPYVDPPMTYSSTTGAWSVLPPIVETTVSLAAGSSGTNVTLSATVKNAATALGEPGALGTMTYCEGTAVVASAVFAGGSSTVILDDVSLGDHAYSAAF